MPTQSDISITLARATLARFVAELFGRPESNRLTLLSGAGVHAELQEAVTALGIESRWIEAVFASHGAGAAVREAYDRILGHTVRSECPPYELEYRTAEVFQQAQTLADISGFYRAFGFEAGGPLVERADHVVAEWEFLAILSLKESLAPSDEDAECCRVAQKTFLAEHAAVWMPAFFERIRRLDDRSFLASAADLADRVLRAWCADLKVSIGPDWLELRPIEDEDSNISCGAPGTVELGPMLASAMEGR